MSAEVANLIFSTQDPTNPPSFINAVKSNFIFSNVNLKNLLGEMWDKYDMFLIKPISVSNIGATTQGTGSQAAFITYNMKGLSYTNLNYETTPNSKQWIPLCQNLVSSATPNVTYFYSNNGWGYTFRKSSPIVDLEFAITLSDAVGITLPPAGNIYNDTTIQFSIEPVIKGYNECAAWVMNINPALSTANNRVGVNQRTYTTYSFNLQDLCREFWADYDEFEIMFPWIGNRGSYVASTFNQHALIQLSGLDFINNLTKQGNDTTNTNSNYSQENAIMGLLQLTTSGSSFIVNTTYPNAPVQFKKQGDSATIVWSIKNFDNVGVTSATGTTSQMLMGFFIRPTYKVEKGTLYLNTWGLTTTETNLGIRDTGYTTVTLKNIDLRLACKGFWNKYKKYNLYLTSYAMAYGSGAIAAESAILKLSGLDLINQTNIQTTNNAQTQIATLGVINLSASSASVGPAVGVSNNFVTSFYRTKDIVDITLTAEQYINNFTGTQTPLLGSFIFTIVPVKDE